MFIVACVTLVGRRDWAFNLAWRNPHRRFESYHMHQRRKMKDIKCPHCGNMYSKYGIKNHIAVTHEGKKEGQVAKKLGIED